MVASSVVQQVDETEAPRGAAIPYKYSDDEGSAHGSGEDSLDDELQDYLQNVQQVALQQTIDCAKCSTCCRRLYTSVALSSSCKRQLNMQPLHQGNIIKHWHSLGHPGAKHCSAGVGAPCLCCHCSIELNMPSCM